MQKQPSYTDAVYRDTLFFRITSAAFLHSKPCPHSEAEEIQVKRMISAKEVQRMNEAPLACGQPLHSHPVSSGRQHLNKAKGVLQASL